MKSRHNDKLIYIHRFTFFKKGITKNIPIIFDVAKSTPNLWKELHFVAIGTIKPLLSMKFNSITDPQVAEQGKVESWPTAYIHTFHETQTEFIKYGSLYKRLAEGHKS
jgi:hypothetical protein